MFVEVNTTVYISEEDFMRMVALCKEFDGYTPELAFWSVADKWEDENYYLAGYAKEEAVKVVEKLLAGETIEFD